MLGNLVAMLHSLSLCSGCIVAVRESDKLISMLSRTELK